MIRIVFVDDEEQVLTALRRALHGMRGEWSMEFVASGPAALESLARAPADLIVSDMRMPGMDGWQLLGQVKKLYPQTVRLVLSGYAEPAVIMRLVGTAHQYIGKPVEIDSLKAAIAQTQLLRHLLTSETLAAVVGKVGTLPSFPAAFREITECLHQPNASVGEAARIISRDVAMTANIMKLVNSAFFGTRRPITSVERAVAYLGLDTLTTLVLGHDLFRSSNSGGLEGLWRHSLQTAFAARTIASLEQLASARIEEAFLAGMLHDVGRVVFASDSARLQGDADTHHAEVGAYLLGIWGFPNEVAAAVALHHTPHRRIDRGLDLAVLVHVADCLAHRRDASATDPDALGIEPELLEPLGLTGRVAQWIAAVDGARAKEAQ